MRWNSFCFKFAIKLKKQFTMPLDITSTVEEKVHVRLSPVTAGGHPAVLDGTPTWEITSGNATIVPDADGLGAFLVSEDTIGSSTWKVSADADLGDGIRTIEDGGTYTYTDAQAAALGLTAETAVPK
jgi:hypothetical protein